MTRLSSPRSLSGITDIDHMAHVRHQQERRPRLLAWADYTIFSTNNNLPVCACGERKRAVIIIGDCFIILSICRILFLEFSFQNL